MSSSVRGFAASSRVVAVVKLSNCDGIESVSEALRGNDNDDDDDDSVVRRAEL